jgi:hypothetical protein
VPSALALMLARGERKLADRDPETRLERERSLRRCVEASVGGEWAVASSFSRVVEMGPAEFIVYVEADGLLPVASLWRAEGQGWRQCRWGTASPFGDWRARAGDPDRWAVVMVGTESEHWPTAGDLDEALALARREWTRQHGGSNGR